MIERSYNMVWGSRASVSVTKVTPEVLVRVSVADLHDHILKEVCEDATLLAVFEVGPDSVGRKVDHTTILQAQHCWVCDGLTLLNPVVDGVQSLGYCGCEG